MKILLRWLGALGLPFLACTQPSLLKPAQFTQASVAALEQQVGDLEIKIPRDLEVQVLLQDQNTNLNLSLERVYYDEYVPEPGRKDELIAKFVTGTVESIHSARRTTLNSARFVPLIKSRKWLEAQKIKVLYDDFGADLVVAYAEDQPNTISYLTEQNIADAGVAREYLRALAVDNLLRTLTVKESTAENTYMLTAGGNYEASLILSNGILKQYQAKVKGKLVVAIPAADMFLLTGSDDDEGLSLLKQTVSRLEESGAPMLTTKMFIYDEDGTLSVIRFVRRRRRP